MFYATAFRKLGISSSDEKDEERDRIYSKQIAIHHYPVTETGFSNVLTRLGSFFSPIYLNTKTDHVFGALWYKKPYENEQSGSAVFLLFTFHPLLQDNFFVNMFVYHNYLCYYLTETYIQ
jgi:hypothetical protein